MQSPYPYRCCYETMYVSMKIIALTPSLREIPKRQSPKHWCRQRRFLAEEFSSVSSVQSLSHVWLFATPWNAEPGFSVHHQLPCLLKLMSIESVVSSNHLILCRPLLLWPSIFPSIRFFSNESVLCIRWSKYWSFSLRIGPSNEHAELISFRID